MHIEGSYCIRILAAILSLSACSRASFKFPHGFPQATGGLGPTISIAARSDNAGLAVDRPENTTNPAGGTDRGRRPACRYLPGDRGYPTTADWDRLNRTVGGRLVKVVPLAQICFGSNVNDAACAVLREQWGSVDPFLPDPVHVMSPYWLNNSCNPSLGPTGSCTLGNMAPYAIRVTGASDVIAGIQFASAKNIRLTIKNTGHDYLGRSTGEGSLALWMHNLKDTAALDYKSSYYKGPALKVGAGIQVLEAYKAAKDHGLRVVGGACPTVGLAGGWLTGGGQGPLTSKYGLGADQALEYEVVTAVGRRLVASPTQNSDLYWALSGGGAGNYAVVLSITVKAYRDGPVAGYSMLFTNTNPESYWAAIKAWIQRLAEIDIKYPTFNSAVTFTNEFFSLDFATLADATESEIETVLAPFLSDLQRLQITPLRTDRHVSPTYYDHYQYFTTNPSVNGTSLTVSNRLIPRSLAQPDRLPTLIDTIRGIATTGSNNSAVFVIINNNVTHAHVGNRPGANAVLPAWRDSLFLLNFGLQLLPEGNAPWSQIREHQVLVNSWLDAFRRLTPGGGSYLNEGTFDYPAWKTEYYGANYGRLAAIKAKYDPEYLFFANAAVGSDVAWRAGPDGSGRLCRR